MNKLKIITATIAMSFMVVGGMAIANASSTTAVLAQSSQHELCRGSGGNPTGKGETFKCESKSGSVDVPTIVERILDVLFYVVGIASVLMLIIGGIRYVVSAGDQNAVTGAKNTILYAIVGIVIAFAAFAISNFVINRLSGTEDTSSNQQVELRQV